MDLIYRIISKEIVDKRITGIDTLPVEEKMKFPPYRVEIQPTTKCNRSCSFCSHFARNKTGQELPQSKVLEIIEDLAAMGCQHISFSGAGEPFEWQLGDLHNIVKFASTKTKMDVTITTNGDRFWDAYQDRPSRHLSLLNSCSTIVLNTPDIYKQNATSDETNNHKVLTALVEYNNRINNICSICSVVIVSKDNLDSLIEIDRYLSNIGIRKIYYKKIKDFEDNRLAPLFATDQQINNMQINSSHDVSIWLKEFMNSYNTTENRLSRQCFANHMALSAIIDPNGDVYPCTPVVGKKGYAIGNVYEATFAQLWNTRERYSVLQRLDEQYVAGECPKECRFLSHNIVIDNFLSGCATLGNVAVNAGIDDVIR